MAAKYSSGQDYMSAAKLNYFHCVLKQLMGYTLHPSIQQASPQTVADLGTQTAIWPIDVAETFPEIGVIDAYDISDKFVPPREWLPGSVQFKQHDIWKLGEEGKGKYDVVHFRLWLTLSTEKLKEMLEVAIHLLKPGGYIQWTEHDKTSQSPSVASPSPETSTEAVEAFIDLQKNPFPGYNAGWVNEIAPTMTSLGLTLITSEKFLTKPSMLPQLHELHLMSLVDVAPGLSQAVDDFKDKYFETLVADHKRGVACMDGFICVVGRKPV